MRILFLALYLLTATTAFAEEPPTFEADPTPGHYATGAVKPLTAEEQKLEQEYLQKSEKDGWTFDFDVRHVGKHALGLKKPQIENMGSGTCAKPNRDLKLTSKKLSDFGIELPPTKDQGSCGSCVYFAITWAFEATNWLYGNPTPILSPRHLMNCSGEGYQCNGAWGESVSEGLVELGGLVEESAYPYRPVSGSCNVPDDAPKYGRIESRTMIEPTPQAILEAIHNRQAVAITVAANGTWSSYRSGVYNACSQGTTNHEIVLTGVDCETAVNADGTCKFDDKGNLPPGVGTYEIQNSWGEDWGTGGRMVTKITDKSGRKCNRVAEEALVLNTGIPIPPEGPVEFDLSASDTKLHVIVQPGELKAETVKSSLIAAGF